MKNELVMVGATVVMIWQAVLLQKYARELRNVLAGWKKTIDAWSEQQDRLIAQLEELEENRAHLTIVPHAWRENLTAKRES